MALSYKDVELTVIVKDSLGRKFDNISSLYLEWTFSQPHLASSLKQGSALMENVIESGVILPGRSMYSLLAYSFLRMHTHG